MNCPNCGQRLDAKQLTCSSCGYDLNSIPWVLLIKVYPPNDLIVESLLKSYGIPVKVIHHNIPQMPVTVGPLAEVSILVPDQVLADARDLLIALEDTDGEL